MSLIFATQLTAVATTALAGLALAAAILAALAFRKQSREVAILAEQNDRDTGERHRAQAARVFTAVTDRRPQLFGAYAKNGSDFPVYDAQFWRSGPDGPLATKYIGMIPPGTSSSTSPLSYQAALATILTFRDAAGARWIRMPGGTLKEQTRDTTVASVLAALAETPSPPQDPTLTAETLQEPADAAGE
jgi:hypothetical protein